MKVHEYQAKDLLKRFGVPISPGLMIEKKEEAKQAYEKLQSATVAVKAQVHAGGRGKAGGIKLAKSSKEAQEAAEQILGMRLVTPQTSAEGQLVRKLYLEAGADIQKELYLALLLDRETSQLAFVACAEGGVEIEELAEKSPEKILTVFVDPLTGFRAYQARNLTKQLGLEFSLWKELHKLCLSLLEAYRSLDANLIEINPLVVTQENKLLVLDTKMTFDDNALYRQKEVGEMRDLHEEDPLEMEANEFGLNYVSLDGEIGCMVNGAGLAMATMDVIKLAGSEPANFLDVGGGASEEAVTAAFQIILKDPKVRAILVNIFGGIMKCDIIARGILQAVKTTRLQLPLVVRLQGTHAEEGRKLLEESELSIITAETMEEAAQKVVEAQTEKGKSHGHIGG